MGELRKQRERSIMRLYDRLYGEITFPGLINSLLDCPALLRLRDVRMANNQFAAFPSFSNTSRYEHSLGVCYLAGICADSLKLSEKDRIELMMACLYHDVGTPPFAHAMEEVLQAEYGFDHENNLRRLVEGTNETYMRSLEQVYLDGTIKLRSICQSKEGRKLGLDVYRIAKIIVGDKNEPLSMLLNGNGMDLDNIDNVIRASSAMGIIEAKDCDLAKRLASAFIMLEDGGIGYNGLYLQDIKAWQRIRDDQYTAIFDSVEDFSYQTMIKKALGILIKNRESDYRLDENSWKLTDSEILFNHLLKDIKASKIMKRVLLEKPFRCLTILYICGDKVASFINTHLFDIEKIASAYYADIWGVDMTQYESDVPLVVANYYPDKRKRPIRESVVLMGNKMPIDDAPSTIQGALLGLFTPIVSCKFKTIILENGEKIRKKGSISGDEIEELMILLRKEIFSQFEVTIHGKRIDKRNNKETSENQLGFF